MTADCTRTLLMEAIEASPFSQEEIAADIGLSRKSILTMILQGLTRVPLYLIPQMSRVLEIDERLFLMTATEEYYPEILITLTHRPGFSREDIELGLLTMCRSAAARGSPPTF